MGHVVFSILVPDEPWKRRFHVTCSETDEDLRSSSHISRASHIVNRNSNTIHHSEQESMACTFLNRCFEDGAGFSTMVTSTKIKDISHNKAFLRNRSMQDIIWHLMVISCNPKHKNSKVSNCSTSNEKLEQDQIFFEVARLRTRLPYILHDEWYNHDKNMEKNRIKLLQDLSLLAKRVDSLPQEVEEFLLEDVLPSLNGDINVFHVFCHGLLPFLSPLLCRSFEEWKIRLFSPLGKLYIGGSARIKYVLVSGMLSALIVRWAGIQWEHCTSNRSMSNETFMDKNPFFKYQILKELVEWTDKLLVTGLIVENNEGEGLRSGQELVAMSAIDFFTALCNLSDKSPTFVAISTPSPTLLYRLLLAGEAFSVEGICGLLLKYKDVLEKWKEHRQSSKKIISDKTNTKDKDENVKVPNIYGMER